MIIEESRDLIALISPESSPKAAAYWSRLSWMFLAQSWQRKSAGSAGSTPQAKLLHLRAEEALPQKAAGVPGPEPAFLREEVRLPQEKVALLRKAACVLRRWSGLREMSAMVQFFVQHPRKPEKSRKLLLPPDFPTSRLPDFPTSRLPDFPTSLDAPTRTRTLVDAKIWRTDVIRFIYVEG